MRAFEAGHGECEGFFVPAREVLCIPSFEVSFESKGRWRARHSFGQVLEIVQVSIDAI